MSKASAYLSVTHFDMLLVLPVNVRLGWKWQNIKYVSLIYHAQPLPLSPNIYKQGKGLPECGPVWYAPSIAQKCQTRMEVIEYQIHLLLSQWTPTYNPFLMFAGKAAVYPNAAP